VRFEWDERKRQSNLEKHAVDFADLESLFEAETVTVLDERFEYDEHRYVTLGLLKGIVLAVAHTETDEQLAMSKRPTSKKSGGDLGRLSVMKDSEVDTSDLPEISPRQFARAVVRRGLKPVPAKAQLTIRVDRDVLAWFRKQGRGYQTRISTLLRAYMEAHKRDVA
jgi:uncharacterized protein (DUF4415 family)